MSYQRFIVPVAVLALVVSGCKHDEEKKEGKVVTEVAVETAKITRATLHSYVEGFGTVEPEPASADRGAASVRLAAPTPGVVAEVPAVEGQRVAKGARLFTLDDRVAKAAVERAKHNVAKAEQGIIRAQKLVEKTRPAVAKTLEGVKFAELTLTREQMLLKQENTSAKKVQDAEQLVASAKAELAAAQADLAAASAEPASAQAELAVARSELVSAETQLSLLHVEAPFAATVVRVNAKPGEVVDSTAILAELMDLDRLVVSAQIPSTEAGGVKLGQSVELGRDKPVSGKVVFIHSQTDAKTDTVLVRVAVPVGAGLRPGQFVNVRVESEARPDRLAVPVESIVKTDDATVIAVVEGDTAKQVPVKVGLRDGGLVEVEGEALKEGMTVVTKGAYGLPKETKVRVPAPPPLDLMQTIPLPGVKGGFDLMAVDVAGKRLFVCAQDNHTLEVIDLAAGKVARSVPGFNEPKWVVYRPETSRLYVATAGDGKVTVLDATTLAVIKSFEFKEKANNLRFDPATKELFVGVGKTFGALGIIDTAADKVSGEIKLANFPKQFELDGTLIYVNVPGANHIAVVDRAKKAVIANWPVKEAKDNVPMALDRAQHRLFIACDPGKFVVFDTASGKSVANLDISAEADGIAYDAARKLIYVSCGEGAIEVIQQTDADHYKSAGKVATMKGAGTSLFVPEFKQLFLLVPQSDKQAAELRVYQSGQ